MIPKIIHYCWLSNDPFPEDTRRYMQTWKEKLPDYEFRLWNFDRFPKEKSLWVSQAFDAKKYAYAADYLRLYALYSEGGIYMDTDVEVVKSFDGFLSLPYMVGTEGQGWIEAGVFGSEPGADWLADCLAYFNKPFIKDDGSFDMVTLPQVMNRVIGKKREIVITDANQIMDEARTNSGSFYLFPKDYFCAKDMGTGVVKKTQNTHSVHHFAMSWIPKKDRWQADLKRKMIAVFGERVVMGLVDLIKKLKS